MKKEHILGLILLSFLVAAGATAITSYSIAEIGGGPDPGGLIVDEKSGQCYKHKNSPIDEEKIPAGWTIVRFLAYNKLETEFGNCYVESYIKEPFVLCFQQLNLTLVDELPPERRLPEKIGLIENEKVRITGNCNYSPIGVIIDANQKKAAYYYTSSTAKVKVYNFEDPPKLIEEFPYSQLKYPSEYHEVYKPKDCPDYSVLEGKGYGFVTARGLYKNGKFCAWRETSGKECCEILGYKYKKLNPQEGFGKIYYPIISNPVYLLTILAALISLVPVVIYIIIRKKRKSNNINKKLTDE